MPQAIRGEESQRANLPGQGCRPPSLAPFTSLALPFQTFFSRECGLVF